MSSNFTVLQDRVIVRPAEVEEVTEGGIILTAQNETNKVPTRGEVVAVGAGRRFPELVTRFEDCRMPMDVKVGDTVVWTKYSGGRININGEELLVMRETDIIGVVS